MDIFDKKLQKNKKKMQKKNFIPQGGTNPRKDGQGRPCFGTFYGVNWSKISKNKSQTFFAIFSASF